MDQDAFRKLLSTSKRSSTSTQSATSTRGSFLPPKSTTVQSKPVDPKKTEFKPRNVKKAESKYRDRAAERRTGAAGDFAEVEDVLRKFEEQFANEDKAVVEEKRKYLGGDLEHSVLVKGLDFALLEQIKARAEAATEDDDLLELAYKGDTPEQSSQQPDVSSSKKRTREDIIKELKNKRAKGDIDSSAQSLTSEKDIETAKKEGKFKPIGFKPIGSSEKSKTVSEDKKKKKKKRKVIEEKVKVLEKPSDTQAQEDKPDNRGVVTEQPTGKGLDIAPEPASESIDDDFDIFADAGEYEGINLDDDDDDENDVNEDVPRPGPSKESNKEHSKEAIRDAQEHQEPRQKWFTDIEPPSPSPEREIPPISDKKGKNKENSDSPEDFDQETEEPEPEAPTRLAPLASSIVPSIRDILAADSALEAEQKRKERKEKRKAGKGGSEVKISDEAKLNRDFQKLKSYTNKKNSVT